MLPLAACAQTKAVSPLAVVLHGPDGAPVPLASALDAHPITVIEFFSATCPCQRAHDARIADLRTAMAARDVGFYVVDSERGAPPREPRGYPIFQDPGSLLARRLGADYATYSVLLGRHGEVLYKGGFDSDRTHLASDRVPYLENAIEDALAGRPVRVPETKALGCTLETR